MNKTIGIKAYNQIQKLVSEEESNLKKKKLSQKENSFNKVLNSNNVDNKTAEIIESYALSFHLGSTIKCLLETPNNIKNVQIAIWHLERHIQTLKKEETC